MASNSSSEPHEQCKASSTKDGQTKGGGGGGGGGGGASEDTKSVEQNSNLEHDSWTKAPNGGWGWIVTFSAFLIRVLTGGINSSSGFFFTEFKLFLHATNSQASWIVSLLNGSYHAIGPIVSVMIALFGWRRVTLFGACLVAVSLLACTWSSNVVTLIVLYGLMAGTGLGVMYVPAVVSVGNYFTTKRSLAIGISACGSGVGVLVFAPLVEFLIDMFGWRGAIWIVAGIVLHGIPLGALLRPIDDSRQTREVENVGVRKGDDSLDQSDDKQSCCNVHHVFDIDVFHSSTFILYGISWFFCGLGLYIPFTYLPEYCEDIGITSKEAAWLISTIGIFNTISRVVVGWLAGRTWTDVIIINYVVLITGGIATICVRYYQSLTCLVVYGSIFGVTYGVTVVMNAIIITELLGVEKLTSSFGVLNAVYGVGGIIGGPIAGAIVDTTGDTVTAFYWAGSVLIISGVICLPLRRISIWERRRTSTSDHNMNTDDTGIRTSTSDHNMNTDDTGIACTEASGKINVAI